MPVEREIKYFFPLSRFGELRSILSMFEYTGTTHEMTSMFDNPNPDLSFYHPKVDGRLRLRVAKCLDGDTQNKTTGLLSWKQRIPEHAHSAIRHEHEVECEISDNSIANMQTILQDILKCPLISSYERERSHYYDDGLKITLDRFPYGLMLEIEFANETIGHSALEKILGKIGLKEDDASRLSCDDMYKRLCKLQNKQIKEHIHFGDKDIPLI